VPGGGRTANINVSEQTPNQAQTQPRVSITLASGMKAANLLPMHPRAIALGTTQQLQVSNT